MRGSCAIGAQSGRDPKGSAAGHSAKTKWGRRMNLHQKYLSGTASDCVKHYEPRRFAAPLRRGGRPGLALVADGGFGTPGRNCFSGARSMEFVVLRSRLSRHGSRRLRLPWGGHVFGQHESPDRLHRRSRVGTLGIALRRGLGLPFSQRCVDCLPPHAGNADDFTIFSLSPHKTLTQGEYNIAA
jgi:hypothetical protein